MHAETTKRGGEEMDTWRALLLGAGLFFCALIDATLAVSLSGDLCENVSVSAINCSSDRFSLNQHSVCSPAQLYTGQSVTLWQIFTISLPLEDNYNAISNSSSCAELGLSSEWRQVLPLRNDEQSLTCSISRSEPTCLVTVNSSLTLPHLELRDCDPKYMVSLNLTGCPERSSAKAGYFSLDIAPLCTANIPDPTETQLYYRFSEGPQCPRMNVTFIGGVPNNVFNFFWNDPRNNRVCFTDGQTMKIGRYTCGWITNDSETCNSTAWLSIANCTTADSGNYSVFGMKADSGEVAHVLLSFYSTKDEDSSTLSTTDKSAIIASVTVLFALAAIASIVCIIVYFRSRRPKSNTTPTSINSHPNQRKAEAVIQVTAESVTVGKTVEAGISMPSQRCVWKTMRNSQQKLTRDDLVTIAQKIVHWQALARKLGLSEPDIVAIEANYSHDYKEQRFQSLLKWFQEKGSPPTRQTLVRIIEEKLLEPQLAIDVESALTASDEDRPRAHSMMT